MLDFKVPSMRGLVIFLTRTLIGSHKISWIELFIENLKTWSENFAKYIAVRVPVNKKLAELIVNIVGSIINPNNIPKYLRTKFVKKNCIINVARRLSDEGSIVLAGRGGDDYV